MTDVIIIGAGIAGLAAARTLVDAQRSVVVLEARNRLGGRIHTSRELGFPIDLGASWIHGSEGGNPIAELVGRQGIRARPSDYESIDLHDGEGRRLEPAEKARVLARNEALFKALDAFLEKDTYDNTVRNLVDRFYATQRLNPAERLAFEWALAQEELDTGGALEELSTWSWDEDEAFPGVDLCFPGGYDQLFPALTSGLEIQLAQPVHRITREATGVRVHTTEAVLEAEYVIVTVPLGVLKAGAIHFDPPLPKWKRRVIRRLGAGRLDKVVLDFEKPFWRTEHEFLHIMDAEPGRFTDIMRWDAHTEHATLIFFVGGRFGERLMTRPDNAVVEDALDTLRRLYGAALPSPRAHLVTRWSQDPWSRCSYTFIPKGSKLKDCETLSYPVDHRLLFAGEATSWRYPGTVHGAWLSGVREAERILASD